MNKQNTITAQSLLNHHQYDRASYLNACENAGINGKEAALFCDEVYGLVEGSGHNTGTGLQYLVSAILLVVVPIGAIAFIVWLINTLIISRL